MIASASRLIRRLPVLLVSALFPVVIAAQGQPDGSVRHGGRSAAHVDTSPGTMACSRVEVGPLVRIAVGKSSVVHPAASIRRIVLGNPLNSQGQAPVEMAHRSDEPIGAAMNSGAQGAVDLRRPQVADVDVVLLSPRELYMLGKSIGSTNVVLVDESGVCTVLDVAVGIDASVVAATLHDLLPAEHDIKVSAAADSLVLSGAVSDSVAADRAVDVATAFVRRLNSKPGEPSERVVNLLSVNAAQQVMLEVKIAEVSKTLLDQFGLDVTRAFTSGNGTAINLLSGVFGGAAFIGSQLTGVNGATVGSGNVQSQSNGSGTTAITTPAGSVTIGSSTVQLPIAAGHASTQIGSHAQHNNGVIKMLAEPTVMAISGQEGSFLAGGKIFIPVAQSNGNGGSVVTLEEKEFGISLKFTPTVLHDGLINLAVAPEVSDLNSSGVALSAPGISTNVILPSFTTRRAATTVQLYDGQSFAIGGLIKNNVTSSINAFPFLGELPVIGALFRSSDFQKDRTELVIVITPHIAKPLPANYSIPTDNFADPTRSDIYLRGRIEGTPATAAPTRNAAATDDYQSK